MTDEEIDIAAMEYAEEYDTSFEYCAARDAFIAGAKWAEEQRKTQSF